MDKNERRLFKLKGERNRVVLENGGFGFSREMWELLTLPYDALRCWAIMFGLFHL